MRLFRWIVNYRNVVPSPFGMSFQTRARVRAVCHFTPVDAVLLLICSRRQFVDSVILGIGNCDAPVEMQVNLFSLGTQHSHQSQG